MSPLSYVSVSLSYRINFEKLNTWTIFCLIEYEASFCFDHSLLHSAESYGVFY